MAWLMPLGILARRRSGVGLAAIAPQLRADLRRAIAVSGLGVAAFHPEGSRYANYLSG